MLAPFGPPTIKSLATALVPSPNQVPSAFKGLRLTCRQVKINKRCKYLWMWALVADSLLVFFKDLVDGWLDDGIFLLSGRATFLHTELLSHTACKLLRGACFLLEVLSNYSTSAMLIERYLAIRRPLWAKRELTLRNVIVVHATCVVPLAILSFAFVCLTYKLVQTPGTLFQKRCMLSPTLGLLGLVVGVLAQQIQYTVHAVLDAVFDALTLVKVSSIRRSSTRLLSESTSRVLNSTVMPVRELRLTFTIAGIALLRTALYLPLAASVALYDIRLFQKPRTQSEFDQLPHAANLSHTLLLLTGIDRLLNFILLLVFVPSFHRVLCFRRRQTLRRRRV